MKRIFVDTNILLDMFLERDPHYEYSQRIWTLVEHQKFRGAISATSMNNIFYVLRKISSKEVVYNTLDKISDIFSIISLDSSILKQSMRARFPDFEDAIQYFSAIKFRAKAIITRDPKGFQNSKIPILDGPQYLAQFNL